MPKPQHHVFVCAQARQEGHPRGSCSASGAAGVFQALVTSLTSHQLVGKVALTQTACLGPCHMGSNVLVYPEGTLYCAVNADDIETIVKQHLVGGQPVIEKLAPKEIW